MKLFKMFFLILTFGLSVSSYAKDNLIWNDPLQDSIQINAPLEYIDSYNKYIVLNHDLKVRVSDFGKVEKNNKNRKYMLQKYGVQVFNQGKVYTIFESLVSLVSLVSLDSFVDFELLYHDKNIFAFRIREDSVINYMKKPYKNLSVNVFFYNFKNNKFIQIPVLNSDGIEGSKNVDLLKGDQVIYNSKNGYYSYSASIKRVGLNKVDIFRFSIGSKLNCISSTLGCEIFGVLPAQLNIKTK
ncbi:hypothetical protein [Acinetobacter sp. MB5]|uniref:hypothetical protein n=1 Tax=Acinetobacter sp. MB5 TaxID=2069438 RepID=UPI000DCFCC07|nr:hypothetical protein [Acinetobacter sp. MB5]